jgi:NAD(P)-dependent dehydrogenase (short-subunit alcohol dehydrogenase family)
MRSLEGRVAIITGAARGIGREHALLLAGEGAHVVVNDLGAADPESSSPEPSAAEVTAAEIRDLGGVAVANTDSIATWEGGRRLVDQAVGTFGRLDVLVNNAGILRDRFLVNMSEEEWDAVIQVNLKGHFVPLRFAAEHWRDQTKAGNEVAASVINTTSTSGLHATPGQANYGAAKSGIATMTEIAAKELQRYGVRVNAIAPAARTRLTMSTPGLADRIAPPADDAFDEWDPANISPLVAVLASERCTITGKTFFVQGGKVAVYRSWTIANTVERPMRWTIDELGSALAGIPEATDPTIGSSL